jgi:hypothetical protein
VVFALASLLGPTVWAVYSQIRHGGTAADIAQVVWRRIWHPLLTWRADDLRHTRGGMTREQAWQLTLTAHLTRPPRRLWRRPAVAVQTVGLDPATAAAAVEDGARAVEQAVRSVESATAAVELSTASVEWAGFDRDEAGLPVEREISDRDEVEASRKALVEVSETAARTPVAAVFLPPPAVPESVSADEAGTRDEARLDDLDDVVLLVDLHAAIQVGDLAEDPSAEAARKVLGVRWSKAAELLRLRRELLAAGRPISVTDLAPSLFPSPDDEVEPGLEPAVDPAVDPVAVEVDQIDPFDPAESGAWVEQPEQRRLVAA